MSWNKEDMNKALIHPHRTFQETLIHPHRTFQALHNNIHALSDNYTYPEIITEVFIYILTFTCTPDMSKFLLGQAGAD